MLVSVVLLLGCWSAAAVANFPPPLVTNPRWTQHNGLLNLALRGSYQPPPGVAASSVQRPSGQYLPPVSPQQLRPASEHRQPAPQPGTIVVSHSPPQPWPPVDTTTGYNQPPVAAQPQQQQQQQKQQQPWIPITTAQELRRPETSRPAGSSQQLSSATAQHSQQNAQGNFQQGHISPQAAPQVIPPQNYQQGPVSPQPASQVTLFRENFQRGPVSPQPPPQVIPPQNNQQVHVSHQPTHQVITPQVHFQQGPVTQQPAQPQFIQPATREKPRVISGSPQPLPQHGPHQQTVQETRLSSQTIGQPHLSSGSGLPAPAPLDFQYLPPPSIPVTQPQPTLDFQYLPPQNGPVTETLSDAVEIRTNPASGGSESQTASGLNSNSASSDDNLSAVSQVLLNLSSGDLQGSVAVKSQTLPTRVVSVAGKERDRPLVIYFEEMHFRNLATEPGFCQAICGSPSNAIEVKAGKCPPIRPGTYRGDCQDLCKYDSECPKQQRCCNVGCANVCLDPVFRKTCDDLDFQCPEGYACIDDPEKIKDAYCVNTTNKVGRCPAEDLWNPRTRSCDQECSYDFQCQADERCCYNGCTMVCVGPDLRKRCEDHNCEQGYACVDDGVNDAKCVSIAPRDGRCPKWTPGQYKKCDRDECQYDEQCPEGEKCCNNGCANVCTGADLRKLCSDIECPTGTACIESATGDAQCFDTAEKDGLCPRISNDTQPRGGCQDTCKYDSQCDDNSKCCFNGCAYVCLRPRKPDCDQIKCKVGYKCTEDRSGNPTCAPIPCKQDGEIIDIECNSCTCIQGYLLCSQEECPPVKPGFCPKITKGYKGKCVEDCDSDYNCADENKCCSTGCGHTCQKPVPEIVHPCKTVRFRCGDATRCAATRGLCQPGKTCPLSPLCVSTRAPFCETCPPGKVCVLQKKSCPNGGNCHRQPICIQLYSDDTIFEEDEQLEQEVVAKQTAGQKTG